MVWVRRALPNPEILFAWCRPHFGPEKKKIVKT